MKRATPKALLWDLDGTLIDTAPDMVGTLTDIALAHALPAPPRDAFRYVSEGSVGLLQLIVEPAVLDAEKSIWVERFLDRYEARVADASQCYDGVLDIIGLCDALAIPNGIVTNKPAYLTKALLDGLELSERFGVVVGGDTLAVRKPNPEPLLHAAAALGVAATDCLYVGDHRRDMEAAAAANMPCAAATWGYIAPGDDPKDWPAQHVIASASSLAEWFPAANSATRYAQ